MIANRHERRKGAKIGRVEMISVDELIAMPSMCAWDGCGASTLDPDGKGWSKMILYRGKTQMKFTAIEARNMARDCVLCPEHGRQLDEQILMNIGGQLRHVEGTA